MPTFLKIANLIKNTALKVIGLCLRTWAAEDRYYSDSHNVHIFVFFIINFV